MGDMPTVRLNVVVLIVALTMAIGGLCMQALYYRAEIADIRREVAETKGILNQTHELNVVIPEKKEANDGKDRKK